MDAESASSTHGGDVESKTGNNDNSMEGVPEECKHIREKVLFLVQKVEEDRVRLENMKKSKQAAEEERNIAQQQALNSRKEATEELIRSSKSGIQRTYVPYLYDELFSTEHDWERTDLSSEELKKKAEILDKMVTALQDKIDAQKLKIEEKSQCISNLNRQLIDIDLSYITKLELSQRERKVEQDNYNKIISELEEEREKAFVQFQELREDFEELELHKQDLEDINSELKDDNRRLKSKVNALEEENSFLQDESDLLKRKILKLRSKMDKMNRSSEVAEVTDDDEAKQQKISEVFNSIYASIASTEERLFSNSDLQESYLSNTSKEDSLFTKLELLANDMNILKDEVVHTISHLRNQWKPKSSTQLHERLQSLQDENKDLRSDVRDYRKAMKEYKAYIYQLKERKRELSGHCYHSDGRIVYLNRKISVLKEILQTHEIGIEDTDSDVENLSDSNSEEAVNVDELHSEERVNVDELHSEETVNVDELDAELQKEWPTMTLDNEDGTEIQRETNTVGMQARASTSDSVGVHFEQIEEQQYSVMVEECQEQVNLSVKDLELQYTGQDEAGDDRNELRRLMEENQMLRDENAETSIMNRELIRQLDISERQGNKLTEENTKLNENVVYLQQNSHIQLKAFHEICADLQLANETICNLTKNAEAHAALVSSFEEELRSAMDMNTNLSNQLDSLKYEKEVLRRSMLMDVAVQCDNKTECVDAGTQYTISESMAAGTQSSYREDFTVDEGTDAIPSSDIKDLTEQLELLKEQVTTLENDKALLSHWNNSLNEKMQEEISKNLELSETLDEEIRSYESRINELTAKVAHIESKMDSLVLDNEERNIENTNLLRELTEANRKYEHYREIKTKNDKSFGTFLTEIDEQISALIRKLSISDNVIKESEEKIAFLQRKYNEVIEKNKELMEAVERRKYEVRLYSEQESDLTSQLWQYRADIENFKDAVIELHNEKEEVEQKWDESRIILGDFVGRIGNTLNIELDYSENNMANMNKCLYSVRKLMKENEILKVQNTEALRKYSPTLLSERSNKFDLFMPNQLHSGFGNQATSNSREETHDGWSDIDNQSTDTNESEEDRETIKVNLTKLLSMINYTITQDNTERQYPESISNAPLEWFLGLLELLKESVIFWSGSLDSLESNDLCDLKFSSDRLNINEEIFRNVKSAINRAVSKLKTVNGYLKIAKEGLKIDKSKLSGLDRESKLSQHVKLLKYNLDEHKKEMRAYKKKALVEIFVLSVVIKQLTIEHLKLMDGIRHLEGNLMRELCQYNREPFFKRSGEPFKTFEHLMLFMRRLYSEKFDIPYLREDMMYIENIIEHALSGERYYGIDDLWNTLEGAGHAMQSSEDIPSIISNIWKYDTNDVFTTNYNLWASGVSSMVMVKRDIDSKEMNMTLELYNSFQQLAQYVNTLVINRGIDSDYAQGLFKLMETMEDTFSLSSNPTLVVRKMYSRSNTSSNRSCGSSRDSVLNSRSTDVLPTSDRSIVDNLSVDSFFDNVPDKLENDEDNDLVDTVDPLEDNSFFDNIPDQLEDDVDRNLDDTSELTEEKHDEYVKAVKDAMELKQLLAQRDKKIESLLLELLEIKNAASHKQYTELRKTLDSCLYELHLRDSRCDEFTQEISQLLAERDTLQLKLSTTIRENEELRSSAGGSGQQSDKDLERKLQTLSGVKHSRDPRLSEESKQRHQKQMDLSKGITVPGEELELDNESNGVGSVVNPIFNWLSRTMGSSSEK